MNAGRSFGNRFTIDPISQNTIGLSLQEILAITFFSSQDASRLSIPDASDDELKRKKSLVNLIIFIKEIVTEYNNPGDKTSRNNKCLGGTINHLIYSLNTVHNDVRISSVSNDDLRNIVNEIIHRAIISVLDAWNSDQDLVEVRKEAIINLSLGKIEEFLDLIKVYEGENKFLQVVQSEFNLAIRDIFYKPTGIQLTELGHVRRYFEICRTNSNELNREMRKFSASQSEIIERTNSLSMGSLIKLIESTGNCLCFDRTSRSAEILDSRLSSSGLKAIAKSFLLHSIKNKSVAELIRSDYIEHTDYESFGIILITIMEKIQDGSSWSSIRETPTEKRVNFAKLMVMFSNQSNNNHFKLFCLIIEDLDFNSILEIISQARENNILGNIVDLIEEKFNKFSDLPIQKILDLTIINKDNSKIKKLCIEILINKIRLIDFEAHNNHEYIKELVTIGDQSIDSNLNLLLYKNYSSLDEKIKKCIFDAVLLYPEKSLKAYKQFIYLYIAQECDKEYDKEYPSADILMDKASRFILNELISKKRDFKTNRISFDEIKTLGLEKNSNLIDFILSELNLNPDFILKHKNEILKDGFIQVFIKYNQEDILRLMLINFKKFDNVLREMSFDSLVYKDTIVSYSELVYETYEVFIADPDDPYGFSGHHEKRVRATDKRIDAFSLAVKNNQPELFKKLCVLYSQSNVTEFINKIVNETEHKMISNFIELIVYDDCTRNIVKSNLATIISTTNNDCAKNTLVKMSLLVAEKELGLHLSSPVKLNEIGCENIFNYIDMLAQSRDLNDFKKFTSIFLRLDRKDLSDFIKGLLRQRLINKRNHILSNFLVSLISPMHFNRHYLSTPIEIETLFSIFNQIIIEEESKEIRQELINSIESMLKETGFLFSLAIKKSTFQWREQPLVKTHQSQILGQIASLYANAYRDYSTKSIFFNNNFGRNRAVAFFEYQSSNGVNAMYIAQYYKNDDFCGTLKSLGASKSSGPTLLYRVKNSTRMKYLKMNLHMGLYRVFN